MPILHGMHAPQVRPWPINRASNLSIKQLLAQVSQPTKAMPIDTQALAPVPCLLLLEVSMHRPLLTLMLKVLRISSGDLPAVRQQQHSV